ncbi:single-stranded-DNA-specific exonuclease RecJ [Dyella caseinilytica]|uniref:Single-stranded-DNA-specific exonuclease RecJ n=1 Tax=Dyella caseinilytica TaxID=1849581 RepID=A0ABX7GXQ9_9GAMM|nr:single-stranded-DNA-specific exonuclease RecJ [Dyella caseinilytica]QRN55282.1 single-stranded-DNA-specific exonuclease RecJ [Dyella caseinilytica]GGA00687.1 single-stranded-DNA-specific exonuclease RecJ [Dyella caseinilytica]
MSKLQLRHRPLLGEPAGWGDGLHPLLQRIYAARGVFGPDQAEHRLNRLLSPQQLGGMQQAVELLAQAIRDDASIMIAGDYDCDGATGSAVAIRGLRLLGAQRVDYVVPNRFIHGYGLTPELVASLPDHVQLVVTVDNGVASVAGVAAAKSRGMRVIVTDHHLPGDFLPAADAIVNPNLRGDDFPSKALAGVGVMFYVLLALRAHLREQGAFSANNEPDLSVLLDLVALGTVADLVPLDFNNRVLVEAGMKRLRSRRGCAGITALVEASQRSVATLCTSDLGYAVGPRLNAAGRLEDMRLGVECLLTDDARQAHHYAELLSSINQERRELQAAMVAEAEVMVAHAARVEESVIGVSLFEPSWHAGVVGLVASKLKERLHRPVIAFAPAGEDNPDQLRGSARSIAGFHIRDALATIDARHPGLIERFGGHAMAAGLSLRTSDYSRFADAFDAVAREWLSEEQLQAVLYTDGEMPAGMFTLEMARLLRYAGPWGQAFPEPIFENRFECFSWRLMGEKHLRLSLRDPRDDAVHDAVMFNAYNGQPPPAMLRAAYELTINDWQGRESPRLLLRHIEPI